jgi:hypothetical protein
MYCGLEILAKRNEDGSIRAYNQKGQFIEFADDAAEPISARDVDVASPSAPPVLGTAMV